MIAALVTTAKGCPACGEPGARAWSDEPGDLIDCLPCEGADVAWEAALEAENECRLERMRSDQAELRHGAY